MKRTYILLFLLLLSFLYNYSQTPKQLQLIESQVANSETKFHYQYYQLCTYVIDPLVAQLEKHHLKHDEDLLYTLDEYLGEAWFSYESEKEPKIEIIKFDTLLLEEIGYNNKFYVFMVEQLQDIYDILFNVICNYNQISNSTNYMGYNMTNGPYLYHIACSYHYSIEKFYSSIFTKKENNSEENVLYPIMVKYLNDHPFKIQSSVFNKEYNHWEIQYTGDYQIWVEFEGEGENTKIIRFTEFPEGR